MNCAACGALLLATPADVRLVAEGEPDIVLDALDLNHPEPVCSAWADPNRRASCAVAPQEPQTTRLP